MTIEASRPFRWVIGCGLLLIAAIAIGTAVMVFHSRARAIGDKERELQNTALLLARHFDQQFEDLVTIQTSLVDHMSAAGINSPDAYDRDMSGRDVHQMLTTKLSALPYVGVLNLIDRSGRLINSSRSWPPEPLDVSDQAFFKQFKSNPRSETILIEPLYSESTGSWAIVIARKLVAPGGEFIGAIVRSIDAGSFEKFFASLSLGDGGAITMFHRDGTLLARHPHLAGKVGRNFKDGPLFQDGQTNSNYGTVTQLSRLDGQQRIAATRTLNQYPIVVIASATVAAALGGWQDQTRFMAGMAGMFAVFIAMMILVIVRQLSRDRKTSKLNLLQEKQRLDIALNNMTQGLLLFDASGRITVCNQRYIDMYGLSREVVKPGCTLREVIAHRKERGSFSGDVDRYCDAIMEDLASMRPSRSVVDTVDGRSMQIVSQPLTTGGWVVTHEDITERRQAESRLEKTRILLDAVVEHMPAILSVKDVSTRHYVIVNRAASRLFGLSSEQMLGRNVYDLFGASQSEYFDRHDRNAVRAGGVPVVHEHAVESPYGVRMLNTTKLTIPNEAGAPKYLISFSEDITERREAEAKISHLAHHDVLTGLANRMLLRERLQAALSSPGAGALQAVCYLDIDHFKGINDTFGHSVGDELLKVVATRLCGCVRNKDTIARLGGDEFVVFLADLADIAEVEGFAQRMLDLVGEPVELGGRVLDVTLSIGISVSPNDAASPEQLLENADAALYEAKAAGRGTYCFFRRDIETRIKARRALELNLRTALAKGEMQIHYQPIVTLADDDIAGCEALLRWQHPELGEISPARFIPVAEETGLINQLGDWVLTTACAEAATWPDDIRLAVNISPIQFRNRTLALKVAGALAASGLPARRLELEITEAVLIGDDETALATLHELRSLGIRIALDDFGTGYSSLSYLQRFPFDKIKIDRCFVQDIATPNGSCSIVQAVLHIAAARHIATTAEGVETVQQREILRELGCTEMQGYLFSPALPAAKILELLHARRAIAATP